MKRILILCTGNSCRSQMAMAYLQSLGTDIEVCSAGTHPAPAVNPYAIETMAEISIDIGNARPRNVNEYLPMQWDYVITVCGGAKESCPAFTGNVGQRLHLGFDDPAAATGTDEEIMAVFRRVRDEIKNVFARFYISEIQKNPLPRCCCGK